MDKKADWVIVGRFGRPHGIKGFVTINSFTEPFDNILNYDDWRISKHGDWVPIKRLEAEVRNKTIVVKVEGYPEREQVAQLTNVEIAVRMDALASLQPGEYYWHQLIGMTVLNKNGERFGIVKDMLATGSNDVLVVQGEKKHLIPYLPGQFVLEVDETKQQIIVDWDLDF